MRYLVLALLLALPSAALAGPCGQVGTNVPLTAETRPEQVEAQQPQNAEAVPGHHSFGSLKALSQAYPH